MRPFVPFVLACAAVSAVACVHEERRPNPVVSNENRAPVAPPAPPQYVLGDPSGQVTHVIPLNAGAQGIVVDRRRVIVSRGEPRMAADQAPETINGAMKLPGRFGGGFLFWTETSLYRSEAFDSALVPVARTPDRIESVSFGPKAIMVRTSNGERWGIGLPKGDRVPLTPLGLVDVVALDDGRALGFDDRGSVFTSSDTGAHWTDATAQTKGKPQRVFMHAEELWLEDENSNAMRLEPDGHLSWFDKVPEDPAVELRPRDPRWRGGDYPLRAAVRMGVAIDDSTALVLEGGDLYRIDTKSGDVVSVVSGKLPPDSTCQGMAVPGDVLFACTSRSATSATFVVSHTLAGEDPIIEQTFGQANLQFYASDDGGLAYAGPCSTAPAAGVPAIATVCVRMPGGTWEERDLSLITTDGGLGAADVTVSRWIPRADGRVVAVVVEPQPGIYDPSSGTLSPVGDELKGLAGRGSPGYYGGRAPYRIRYSKHSGGFYYFIDSSWTFSGSTIRGTSTTGESFEILEDGRVKPSPYTFDALYSFNLGVGKSKDGRLYQTNDHGATWTEVATPPTGMEPLEMLTCSSVGCDFGAFYRIGWQLRPPHPEPQTKPAPPAPGVRHVRGVELSCRASGAVTQKVLPRTDSSPEDLGLGATRLPTTSDKNEFLYVRSPSTRAILSAWSVGGDAVGSGSESEMSPSLRMMLSGYSATQDDNGMLIVNGPTKSIMSLRRGVAYVPPFDPSGRVVRTGIQMTDVVAAARRAGLTTDEILSTDPTESGSPFAITPLDPNGVGDVGLHEPQNGVVSVFRGERARIAVRGPNQNSNTPIAFSGVALPNDETAILEAEAGGNLSHVYKMGPGGIVDLFDVGGTTDVHPANPDALAVGPKSELAIIRTPSGADPPSELDPAYLVVQGSPPTQLAAWSTMKFADDPACKAETGGHRATIQAIGPWIRVTNPDLKIEDSAMFARVRWTPNRVCLEGFEVKLPLVNLPIVTSGTPGRTTISTWLIAKGSTFARVSIAEGIEWRQPLECTVVSTGP